MRWLKTGRMKQTVQLPVDVMKEPAHARVDLLRVDARVDLAVVKADKGAVVRAGLPKDRGG